MKTVLASIKTWWNDDSDSAPLHVMDIVLLSIVVFLVISANMYWAG